MAEEKHRAPSALLAWYFVVVWGSGYLATKVGLQYAPPFTFLALRFSIGLLLVVALALVTRPSWPQSPSAWMHLIVAGLLMHAVNLGGSHYAQFLGMSAGIAALILALQPLATAAVASRLMGETLQRQQWIGVVLGLGGVALVVWHKIDIAAMTPAALLAVTIALAAITIGTLYQRIFCPTVDLRGAAVVQFAATAIVMIPLAVIFEGFTVRWSWQLFGAIGFLVFFASLLAVNALHTLMRRGEATRVTSLLYLTPVIAVALEWWMFGVRLTLLSAIGIVVTCVGVALVAVRRERVARPQSAGVG